MTKGENLVQAFRERLLGLRVSHVWRGHGSALFIEFGELRPGEPRRDGSLGNPAGEMGLMIEWSWRIEAARSILCGSWSDETRWPAALDRLRGATVTDLTTFGRLPEVAIALSGDLHVTSFMTAEGDPAWALFDRRGGEEVVIHCREGEVQAEA